MTQPPFGHFQPNPAFLALLHKCRKLPATWWGKQRAQRIRKKVLKDATLPMDLILEGAALRCFLTDNISERGFVFMPWRFDFDERAFLLSHLPSDGVFVDVGANVGIYSCLALTVLKDKGRVVAIEPNPPVAERLAFNLAATANHNHSRCQITSLQKGVSNQAGSFSLFLDQSNLGASSLKGGGETEIQITCLPLLDLLSDNDIKHVDAMKVDIEGAEDLALVPFLEYADEPLLPQVLIFENNQNQWQLDVMSALKSRGYELHKQTRMNYIFTRKLSDSKP